MNYKKANPVISVVVPVFNEENNIEPFLLRTVPVLARIGTYEIIFVMDPSRDGTEAKLQEARRNNNCIKYLKLSRRFGQPAATMAGINFSNGNHVVVIDVDLQDPPEAIEELYKKAKEGYQVVYATRTTRDGETWIKKKVAKYGYKTINYLSDVEIPINTGDFRIMSRLVVEQLKTMSEKHGFLRGMVSYIGYSQAQIFYKRDARLSGKGNYNRFLGSIRIGMNGLIGFSSKPLVLMSMLGAIISFLSFGVGLWYLLRKFAGVQFETGLPTIVITLTFLSGIQLLSLGLLGEYISRIYDEVKKRPNYIVETNETYDQ